MSIALTRRDEFALLTIDRQASLNALNLALIDELARSFAEAARGDARGLIVTGAGDKAFCAGADIAELEGRGLMRERADNERGQAVFAMLDRLPIPSLALVNGFALGGGLELALACTFRLATRNATLGLPEIKLGLVPGYGGTQRLPRLIGEARALELILSGRRVDAEEALRIGLVHSIVEGDPLGEAMGFLRRVTGHSLPVLRLAREAVQRAQDQPLAEGFRTEVDLAALAFQTEDAAEGVAAFLAKRKPVFRDR